MGTPQPATVATKAMIADQGAAGGPRGIRGAAPGRHGRGSSPTDYRKELVGEGEFSAAVLDGLRARGQPVEIVLRDNPLGEGYWIGIQIDRPGRRLVAGGYERPGLRDESMTSRDAHPSTQKEDSMAARRACAIPRPLRGSLCRSRWRGVVFPARPGGSGPPRHSRTAIVSSRDGRPLQPR